MIPLQILMLFVGVLAFCMTLKQSWQLITLHVNHVIRPQSNQSYVKQSLAYIYDLIFSVCTFLFSLACVGLIQLENTGIF